MSLNKTNIVIFLLVVNTLVAITSGFEITGSFHTGLWRAVIMAALLPILIYSLKVTRTSKVIFAVFVYLFIALMTNTYFWSNFSTFISVVFSLLMYPIAYTYIYNKKHHVKLYRTIFALLLIFCVHFIWAQAFNVGRTPYVADIVYLGGGGVQQTYMIAYFLLFIPFLILCTNITITRSQFFVIIISLAPIFLIFRRAAVLSLLFGFVFYAYFTPLKGRFVRFILGTSVVLILLSPLYFEKLTTIAEHRPTDPEDFGQVGRTREITEWFPRLIKEKGLSHAFWGSELYDYGALTGARRPLHSDYAVYLIGSGIVGFLLYFSVLIFIWKDFSGNAKYIKNRYLVKETKAVLAALTIAYLIISYSGQYYVVSALSVIMMFFGVINRYIYEEAKKSINQKPPPL